MSDSLVLDAGALIALDRDDRGMWAVLRVAADEGSIVAVPAGAIAQTWRDGSRQALLSRALKSCIEVDLNGDRARAAGSLCGQTGTSDIVDASVALLSAGLSASGSVTVFTSDPKDIAELVDALNAKVRIELS